MKKAEAISILAASVRPREAKDRARYDEAVKMAIEALKCSETPKSSEQTVETAQADHIADTGKKVGRTAESAQNTSSCAHENDVIFRQAAIDAVEKSMYENPHENEIHRGMHDHEHRHFLTILMGLPSAQPATNCSEIPNSSDDTISRQAAIDALARMMPRSYTPDGSHPADEEIFQAQEVIADCIEALEILPSAQPEQVCVANVTLIDEQVKEAVEKAKNAVTSVIEPEPHWIPCSERLPERADNVIICYKAGDYTLVSTGRYLYKFKMWYVDVVGDLRDGVTAWMPLPEPYKGGDTE